MAINVWGSVGGVAGFIPMSALIGAAGQILGMDATGVFAEWKAVKVLGNQLILPAGNAGAPSLSWGDLDTGFYKVAGSQLGLSILGTRTWLATAGVHQFGVAVQFDHIAEENQAADVAAVNGITDLVGCIGNYVQITNAAGAKAITSWGAGTFRAGTEIETKFVITGGSLSLTHDPANLIVLGGASFALLNGDVVRWRKINDVSSLWEMVGFQRGLSSSQIVAKGDLIAGLLSGGTIIPGIRGVGSDGQVLAADSSQSAGLIYIDNPSRPNLLINPNWQIDQINEGGLYTVTGGGGSVQGPDGWSGNGAAAPGVFKLRTLADPDNAALKCLEITCTTIDAAIAATDRYIIFTTIEGYDAAALMAGTASAQPIIIQFKFKTSVPGVYGVRVQNSTSNRSYVGIITVADAAEHEYTISLTMDTAGVWLYTNGIGLQLSLCLAAGANFQTAAGAWQAGDFHTTAAQVNFMSNVANIAYLKRIQLLPGSLVQAYKAADIQKELTKAKRYYQKSFIQGLAVAQNTGSISGAAHYRGVAGDFSVCTKFEPTMRAVPSLTGYNPGAANGNWRDDTPADRVLLGFVSVGDSSVGIAGAAAAVSANTNIHWTANARLS